MCGSGNTASAKGMVSIDRSIMHRMKNGRDLVT